MVTVKDNSESNFKTILVQCSQRRIPDVTEVLKRLGIMYIADYKDPILTLVVSARNAEEAKMAINKVVQLPHVNIQYNRMLDDWYKLPVDDLVKLAPVITLTKACHEYLLANSLDYYDLEKFVGEMQVNQDPKDVEITTNIVQRDGRTMTVSVSIAAAKTDVTKNVLNNVLKGSKLA